MIYGSMFWCSFKLNILFHGHPRQYILVDTIFNHRFHFGLKENVCRQLQKTYLLRAGEAGKKHVCSNRCSKDILLKSTMKPVVKYGVY